MTLIRNSMYASRSIAAFCVMVATAIPSVAQTHVDPGFNLFSTEQEAELGQQSAREIERELPVLNDRNVVRYIEELGSRLVQEAPGADYPYAFRVLDVADVNAFALPGGYIYVNRGLIEAVRNEGELAGVLAHEIGHVALRHSTNQISKDYLAQAGLSVLGGLIGDGTTSQILDVVGATGVSLLFLKFSRSAEEQADTVGAQMMARSGYDPLALASFFSQLESESRGAPAEFLSSHPNYASRRENIQNEASLLDRAPSNPVGGLSNVQARLDDMRPAPTMAALLDEEGATVPSRNPGGNTSSGDIGNIEWERPSSRFVEHTQRNQYYRIDYPDNWRVHAGDDGFAVTIVPNGGIVRTGSGRQEIVMGALVNHYTPFLNDDDRPFSSFGFRSDNVFESAPSALREATRDLLIQILDGNPHLQPSSDSLQQRTIDGGPGLAAKLLGTSPVTGELEHVTLLSREAGDGHVLYVLLISPDDERDALQDTFDRMISSLEVNDRAVHYPER